MNTTDTLLFSDLGLLDYPTALSLQEELVAVKQEGKAPDLLLFLEHPHVVTLGRGGKESSLLFPGDIPVYRAGRGGDATYHGPGQMVVYPLIDLKSKLRKDVHRYLRNLETAAIRTLEDFGLETARKPPWTGIWIDNRKIAAIGVAVRRGVAFHGLALNVNTDLSYFQRIIPCGLRWAEVTSMRRELGREQPPARVRECFLRHFAKTFSYTEIKELCRDDIPIGLKSALRATPTISVSNGC